MEIFCLNEIPSSIPGHVSCIWKIELYDRKKKEETPNCSLLCARILGLDYFSFLDYVKDYCRGEILYKNNQWDIQFTDAISAQILVNSLNLRATNIRAILKPTPNTNSGA